MKVYVWEEVGELTVNYHCSGGLVVIAEDENHVRELLRDFPNVKINDKEWEAVFTYPLSGTPNFPSGYEPRVFVFPDAGCC